MSFWGWWVSAALAAPEKMGIAGAAGMAHMVVIC